MGENNEIVSGMRTFPGESVARVVLVDDASGEIVAREAGAAPPGEGFRRYTGFLRYVTRICDEIEEIDVDVKAGGHGNVDETHLARSIIRATAHENYAPRWVLARVEKREGLYF
jgi:hypothetical protein